MSAPRLDVPDSLMSAERALEFVSWLVAQPVESAVKIQTLLFWQHWTAAKIPDATLNRIVRSGIEVK